MRTHLIRLQKATGQIDARLAESQATFPPALEPLWTVFVHLNDSRGPDTGIAPTEIEAYGRLHHLRLTSWEVDTLLATDRAWRIGIHDKTQGRDLT